MAAVTRARIPVWALSYCTVGLVGYDACFTRRRSRVRTSDCVRIRSGRVAQMAERRSNKPSVVGSIPTVTTFCLLQAWVCRGKKVLPGFEPGSLDSKSRVLTNYTIRPLVVKLQHSDPSDKPSWLSWQSARLLTDRSLVRAQVRAFLAGGGSSPPGWRRGDYPHRSIIPR